MNLPSFQATFTILLTCGICVAALDIVDADAEYLGGTTRSLLLGRRTLTALTILRPEAHPLAVKGERGGVDMRSIATLLW